MSYRYTLMMTDPEGNVLLSIEEVLSAEEAVKALADAMHRLQDSVEPAVEEDEPEDQPAPKKAKVGRKKGATRKPCPECGSIGTKHKNGCGFRPNRDRSVAGRMQDEAESALAPEIKERIKDMRDKDMTTTEIAEELAGELDMDFDAMKSEVTKIVPRGSESYAHRGEGKPAERKLLSSEQFEALSAAMHDRDFSSAQYALSQKLSPKEVNIAVLSPTYEEYAAPAA